MTYRAEVLEELARHGLCPRADTALALKSQRPALVRRMAWSAAPAAAVARARGLGLAVREFTLAAAGDDAVNAAALGSQADDIIKFLIADDCT